MDYLIATKLGIEELKGSINKTKLTIKGRNYKETKEMEIYESIERIYKSFNEMLEGEREALYLSQGVMGNIDLSLANEGYCELYSEWDFVIVHIPLILLKESLQVAYKNFKNKKEENNGQF